jgi:hypothetical protein
MLKPLYTIQQFSEKVSNLSTLKELIVLCQEPTIDLSINTSAMQLSWNAKTDAITSGGKIVFQLALNINGRTYEPSMGQEVVVTSLSRLEEKFLETLKRVICAVVK